MASRVWVHLAANSVAAMQQGFVAVLGRAGVQFSVWLLEPEQASHNVVLFSGGQSKLKITPDGIGRQSDFLVRTREQCADKGMLVALVDKPSDRADLHEFRSTAAHAEDIRALIEFLRKRHSGWLVPAAARIQGDAGPDGIVLTSSVTRGGKNNGNRFVRSDWRQSPANPDSASQTG